MANIKLLEGLTIAAETLGGDVEDPKGPRRKKHLPYVGSPVA